MASKAGGAEGVTNWVIRRFGTIGSRFSNLQYWVAYTASDGERIQMLGCDTSEQADAIVKRFRDTGLMKNPYPSDDRDDIEPLMVAKMQTRVIYRRVPVK